MVLPQPQSRGEVRRQAMVEAACELFLEKGFEGTSVHDVVEHSGGSLATLYDWFGSKEGLFEAIVERIAAQVVAPLEEVDFESRPLAEALQFFGEQFLKHVLCTHAVRWHRMCVAEGGKFPELRQALLRSGAGRVQDRLAAYLAAQARAGRLRSADPVVAAGHYLALVKSEQHLAALCGETPAVSRAAIAPQVERAVAVFLQGYGRRRTASSRSQR